MWSGSRPDVHSCVALRPTRPAVPSSGPRVDAGSLLLNGNNARIHAQATNSLILTTSAGFGKPVGVSPLVIIWRPLVRPGHGGSALMSACPGIGLVGNDHRVCLVFGWTVFLFERTQIKATQESLRASDVWSPRRISADSQRVSTIHVLLLLFFLFMFCFLLKKFRCTDVCVDCLPFVSLFG